MPFYLISSARPTDSGRWLAFAGTQANARAESKARPQSRWAEIEIDRTNAGLVTILNQALEQGGQPDAIRFDARPAPETPPLPFVKPALEAAAEADHLDAAPEPRPFLTRRDEMIQASATIQGVQDAIATAEGYVFANMLEAVLERLQELGPDGLATIAGRPNSVQIVRGLIALGSVA